VEQGTAAGRGTDKFITEKWVMERLKTQNHCCAERECMRPLLLEWDATDEEERGRQLSGNNALGARARELPRHLPPVCSGG
jgi:hypothetical protein